MKRSLPFLSLLVCACVSAYTSELVMTGGWSELKLGSLVAANSVGRTESTKRNVTISTSSVKDLSAAPRVNEPPGNPRFTTTVNTLTSPQPPPFQFGPIVVGPNGRARLVITNEPGKPFTLEASVDLINWITLDTIATNQSPVEYRDAGAVGLSQRFYRAKQ